MQQLALKAYGDVQKRTASDRQIEVALFRQITLAMEHADADVSLADWADAVNRNQQLWSILAADLLGTGNGLSSDIRRSLLTLADFVRRQSLIVLEGEAEIGDLVEINKSIIDGLEGVLPAPVEDAA